MTTKEILQKARALVEAGWMQGASFDAKSGCYCASGAICAAANLSEIVFICENRTCTEARSKFATSNKLAGIGIVPWNDAPGRTKDEVLAAFDKAIEACNV